MFRTISNNVALHPGAAVDPHLSVTIAPTRSAYFAGEQFEAVITFTNTSKLPIVARQTDRFAWESESLSKAPSRSSLIHDSGSRDGQSPNQQRRLGLIGRTERRNDEEVAADDRPTSPHSPEWRERYQRGRGRSAASAGSEQDDPNLGLNLRNGRSSNGIPKSHPHSRKPSENFFQLPPNDSSTPSSNNVSSPSLASIAENVGGSGEPSAGTPPVAQSHRRLPSYMTGMTHTSALSSFGSSPSPSPPPPPPTTTGHVRASLDISQRPTSDTSTTILWCHTRLQGHFTPSQTYIPPDPLLPLRSALLHRPLGSGSLIPIDQQVDTASRWNLSFGSGTIGAQQNPSLTGSLFGLAKGILGGDGGSLEEERKRIWASKDLPVFDTVRSLIGIDLRLRPGESKSFRYAIIIPAHLPPTFRGMALRFHYELSISINVLLSSGSRQHTQEFKVPIRVWPYVAIPPTLDCYDVLDPVIQRTEKGSVTDSSRLEEVEIANEEESGGAKTLGEVNAYIKALLRGEELDVDSHQPPDPKVDTRFATAVQLLSKTSSPASFEMAKEGEVFATVTLPRTIFYAGQSIVSRLEMKTGSYRVAKFSASLSSNENIPSPLLPPSPISNRPEVPHLHRSVAHAHFNNVLHILNLGFDLHIPMEITPSFKVAAGTGSRGGLSWYLRLHFLVFKTAPTMAKDYSDADNDYAVSYLVEDDASGHSVEATIPLQILPGNEVAGVAHTFKCMA